LPSQDKPKVFLMFSRNRTPVLSILLLEYE
jgi:hypothetical protein